MRIELIGVPYEVKDCFGLAQEFYKLEMDISLKNYYEEIPKSREEALTLVEANLEDFDKVEEPKYGDLILIRLHGVDSHIGVYLNEGTFLHTTKPTGSVVDRITKWEKLIVGYYRLRK